MLSEKIEQYFDAFSKGNYKALRKLCSTSIEYYDPVFEHLKGKEVFALHHFLSVRRIHPTIELKSIKENNDTVNVTWMNNYLYSTYNTSISIVVRSIFEFRNGVIISQKDDYSLWKWSKMALGFTGTYFGWTPIFRSTLRRSSQKSLNDFIKKNPRYQV